MMKAIRVNGYGGPDVLELEEIERPKPGHGQALVRVAAAGVGPWDALIRTGRSGLPQTLPLTLGSDICGVIEALGPDPTEFRVGDEVFGVTNASFTGGYAEYALASVDMIARKPTSIGFIDAASVPVVAVTAWQMLFDRARLTSGQRVLVYGAGGNVGAYLVQFARWAGAYVVATGHDRDHDYMMALGANEVFEAESLRLEKLPPFDAIMDTIGTDVQTRSLQFIKSGGILVSSVEQPSVEEARKRGIRVAFFIVCVTSGYLDRVARLIDDGLIKPLVGTVLPLSGARRAHMMLAGEIERPSGKIVLEVARGRSSRDPHGF